jgi:thymidylate kinase
VLIIEGPDGSGKSTLCNMLLSTGTVSSVKPSPRITAKGDVDRMKYETDRYIRLYGEDNKVAVDRFLFSEMAYGKVLRGKSAFSKAEYMHKLIELMLKGSVVIFCLPDTLIYKLDESPVVKEKMSQIRNMYDNLVNDQALTSARTYIYKWNEPEAFDNLLLFLLRWK